MQVPFKQIAPELWKSYPLLLLAVLPAVLRSDVVLAIFFSGHGGLSWLLLLAALPWVTIRILRLLLVSEDEAKTDKSRQAVGIACGYIALSVSASAFLAWRLSPPLELTVANTLPWFYFPVSLLFAR